MKFDESRSWNWKGKVSEKNDSQFYLSEPEVDEHEAKDQVGNNEVTEEGGVNRPKRSIQLPHRYNDYVILNMVM